MVINFLSDLFRIRPWSSDVGSTGQSLIRPWSLQADLRLGLTGRAALAPRPNLISFIGSMRAVGYSVEAAIEPAARPSWKVSSFPLRHSVQPCPSFFSCHAVNSEGRIR
jgi:hypothetical protein